ncbi:hypothetical protein DWF00_27160 [Bosea caraganae]|uniref:Type I restriction enzyme R protein N-terminal domain-containing protein n=1 Tax=Bosea caraganae TaxID=2763117 RepID=A0A370L9F4_9HYPH|nr:hypothetical protein [Bosea caraganae]RDJ22002.1 hypothetical protein DWF00_27160 [Bosea caraganae]RDJ27964.1 hypothetical protein DWE98_04995 [Bosea caraganae]
MQAFAKQMQPMSASNAEILKRLATLDLSNLNETDVREAFLAPLIDTLGYIRGSDYTVLTEQQYALNPLFLSVGSKRIKLDYRFNTYRTGFWLLEAKEGTATDPNTPPQITSDMIGQAHFYAHHREVDCPLFGVSNGWFTNLYDRDSENPLDPVLSIPQRDIVARYSELYALIGFDQITFRLKRSLLKRIEQVLSADVDLSRGEEFVRAVAVAAASARPKVLENFRKAAAVVEAQNDREFFDYLDNAHTWEAIDTLLQAGLSMGDLGKASDRLAVRVAQYQGSNQYLFFHKLLLKDTRPVSTEYYFNSLHLLGNIAMRPALADVCYGGGTALTPITEIYAEYADLLVHHLMARPELRLMWALEAVSRRLCKRFLVSADVTRDTILGHVEIQRFINSEERNAFLGPSPARTLLQIVDHTTMGATGRFFAKYYNPRNRSFAFPVALAEYQGLERAAMSLETKTEGAYVELKKSLGGGWSELTFIDSQNRSFDRLGHGVCDVISSYPALLSALSERTWARIEFLARLGNPFAKTCLQKIGRAEPTPHPDVASELITIFDPSQHD